MGAIKWALILPFTMLGIVIPWQYQAVTMTALVIGYAACRDLSWTRFQSALAYIYGGLATGLGMQILIAYGMKNQPVKMILLPLLTWLVLRVIYYAVETQYSLTPDAALTAVRLDEARKTLAEAELASESPQAIIADKQGHSAWSGNTSGTAQTPAADGSHRYYEFYAIGEIAMGGPTYGDVVFSNRVAFTGVGPSVAISDSGRYAAMTMPSRGSWGALLVDLDNKIAYQSNEGWGLWEIDDLDDEHVRGRFSPLTSNQAVTLKLSQLMEQAEKRPLVEDDGWWLLDEPGRVPLPKYPAVSVCSANGLHKATFVPDLHAQKANPFARMQHPKYSVLVDDVLLEQEASYPHAVWIDGEAYNAQGQLQTVEGRFLVVHHRVYDFMPHAGEAFNANAPKILAVQALDTMPNVSLGDLRGIAPNKLHAQGIIMPRSTDFTHAEYEAYSTTHPWDEEEVTYWDVKGKKRTEKRTHIQMQLGYTLDLAKLSAELGDYAATTIQLQSRAQPEHSAQLLPELGKQVGEHYSAYTLQCSCGVTMHAVTQTLIWSRCGRYLAVLMFASPPQVPDVIQIVDFKLGQVRTLSGRYALASFIWFDEKKLELSHVIATRETIIYGIGKESDNAYHSLTDSQYADDIYGLLIGNRTAREQQLTQQAEAGRTGKGYAGASVNQVSQHVMLFAPDFDVAVLQPPISAHDEG